MSLTLTGQEQKVLTALFSLLNTETFIPVQQANLARRLPMHKAGVFSAIERLIERGILERGRRFGHSASFRLNATSPYWSDILATERLKQVAPDRS